MILIAIIVIIPLYLLIKKGSDHVKQYFSLLKYIIKVFIGLFIIGIVNSIIHFDEDTIDSIGKIYLIGAAVLFIILRLSYQYRAKQYISDYLLEVLADNSRTNKLTEASFFSQPKTKKYLSEKAKVGEQTNYQFMQECFQSTVMSALKNTFINSLFENGNIVNDRVFFYYEFNNYIYYLKEQKMDLIDVLSSFNIVQNGFSYIEDAVFFSNELLDRMTNDFIPFLTRNPKLSDVPFSEEYLSKTMYEQGMLSPYVPDDALECLRDDRELFEDDFIALYGGVANEEITIAIEQGKLNVQPNPNDKKKQAYSLKHEDENGIIQSEYGMDFEQHRENFDINLEPDQLDDLAGCPA